MSQNTVLDKTVVHESTGHRGGDGRRAGQLTTSLSLSLALSSLRVGVCVSLSLSIPFSFFLSPPDTQRLEERGVGRATEAVSQASDAQGENCMR